jgi:ABC-type oligopeptide transport system substrate-binding subunit
MGPAVTAFDGYVPLGQPGYDGHLKTLGYSVTAARAALKAAGYPAGKGFPATTLYYADDPANPGMSKLARSIAKAWRKALGISVDTEALTLNTLLAKVQSSSLPLYLSGWSADYPDPHDWLSGQWSAGAPNNNVQYRSSRFDKLVRTADVTWDNRQRMRLYNAAQQVLVSDAAWIPLYIPHRLGYIRPEVSNLVLTGYGIIPRAGTWAGVEIRTPPPRPQRAM